MSLIAQAAADWKEITSNSDEFGVSMTLTAPTGSPQPTATIVGLHTKHHLQVDTEGRAVNSKNAHVSFSEKLLTDAGYTTRNAEGEIALKNHRVSVKDSTTETKEYVILQTYPDETVGVIVCILGDYAAD